MNTIFLACPIGSRFEFGGTAYFKASSRTARLEENMTKFYYFSHTDRIKLLGKA